MRLTALDYMIAGLAHHSCISYPVIFVSIKSCKGSRALEKLLLFAIMLLDVVNSPIDSIAVTQKLEDITNSNDFLIELITVGMGQHEVLQSRQKFIDGVATKAKQSAFLGGYAPLGYDIVNNKYIVNEYEAQCVRKIFQCMRTVSARPHYRHAGRHERQTWQTNR